MASNDDSSVDGMSSVGDAWEEVESTYSENETANSLSRQLTPMSEHPESLEYGVSSILSVSTSQDGQAPATPESHDEPIPVQQEDTSIFTPTAATLNSASWSNTDKIACGFDNGEAQAGRQGYIKVKEDEPPAASKDYKRPSTVDEYLLDLEGRALAAFQQKRLCPEPTPLKGFLQMSLAAERMSTRSPFEILYVGPTEMRSILVEKVGAILTARTGNSQLAEIDSSRVTVVPVSDFHNDASPEVVLIDSVGVDMEITECQRAWKEDDTISLKLSNDPRTLTSLQNWAGSAWKLSRDFARPHVAIVYVPGLESETARTSRLAATHFFLRHNIPFLAVCSNIDAGLDNQQNIDVTLPYIQIRRNSMPSASSALDVAHLPIDLATFLALDASQLNRALAHSIEVHIEKNGWAGSNLGTVLLSWPSSLWRESKEYLLQSKQDVHDFHENFPTSLKTLWFSWVAQIRGRPVYYTASLMILLFLQIAAWIIQPSIMIGQTDSVHRAVDPLAAGTTNLWISDVPNAGIKTRDESEVPKRVDALSIREISLEDLFGVSKPAKSAEKTQYRANVLGDSHVIVIRDAQGSQPPKNAPKMYFGVQRNGKPLVHDVTKVSSEVHVIELPVEDAYGKINITAWTKIGPKVNETFQVDFGTPWLKISAWLNSAQAMNKQARADIMNARLSLSEAVTEVVKNANGNFSMTFHDTWDKVYLMVKGVQDKAAAARPIGQAHDYLQKRHQILNEMIERGRKLDHQLWHKLNQSLVVGESKLRRLLDRRTALLEKQKAKISSRSQSVAARAKASVPRLSHLKDGVQNFRSKNLRPFEKRVLQAWWKIRGAGHGRADHGSAKGRRACSDCAKKRQQRQKLRKGR